MLLSKLRLLCFLIVVMKMMMTMTKYQTFAEEDNHGERYAEENPRIDVCDNTNNYTAGSNFSSNLRIALKTLQNNTAPSGGFSSTTQQQGVTALALCRATITPPQCQQCIDSAVVSIRRVCPNQTSAQIWHTYCMIRYSSSDIINKTDTAHVFGLYDERDVPHPIAFDQTVRNFTENLAVLAGKSAKRFAVAKTKVTTSGFTLYGYVECTRDVDGESCDKCLLSLRSYMMTCCSGKWAIWAGTPTCSVQINLDPVHKDWKTAADVNSLLGKAPDEPGMETEKGAVGGGNSRRETRYLIIGGVAGAVVMAIIVGVLCVVRMRKCNGTLFKQQFGEDDDPSSIDMRPFLFDLDALIAATDNFSSQNMLGKGGFGIVYKGRMPDGREIAVKKLATNSVHGRVEFENEVRVLQKMQHRNLVQLLGCCVQQRERILVYEYLPNRCLDQFLFDKRKSGMLDWSKRLEIIMGVARGLVYLHQDSILKIIHRDIKASNILLDHHRNPKISDFGLAKLFHDEQTRHRTRQIAGTFGYMAPEYAIRGLLSVRSDVFSFGVLMLEIISGRRNFDRELEVEKQELLKHARQLEEEGRLLELVDESIGNFPEETALRFMQIALHCTENLSDDRPTMSATLSMLSYNSAIIPSPADQSPLQQDADESDGAVASRRELFSRNSITFSLQDGR